VNTDLKETNELEDFQEVVYEDEDAIPKARDKFDEIFAEAVYEGLSWISCVVAPVLHIYMEGAMTFEIGLRKSKLSIQDAKTLEKSLEKIFGFGARVIEYRILKILYAKLKLKKEFEQNFKFSNEVEKAKELYEIKLSAGENLTIRKCESEQA